MRLRAVLLVEEGPAALKQIAAIVGFAQTMDIKLTMVPEEEPKKEHVAWSTATSDFKIAGEDASMHKQALKLLSHDSSLPRKEFVRALAKATGKAPKSIGAAVSRWIKGGILEEVQP